MKYEIEKYTKNDLNRIVIPKFQRGLTWDRKRQKKLIETIRQGEPIGVILVHKDGDNLNLVDGLQRMSTIKSFLKAPLKFFEKNKDEVILKKHVEELLKIALATPFTHKPTYEGKVREVSNILFEALESRKDSFETTDILKSNLEANFRDSTEVPKYIQNTIFSHAQEFTSLPDFIIPAIVYKGEKDELPAIFEKINTGSVNLTKYEILAASWPSTSIKISDEEIINKVIDKYRTLKETSSFEMDFDEDSLVENGINLFEYCYAVGELIISNNKVNKLFGSKKEEGVKPIGFELLALILGGKVNETTIIEKNLKDKTPEFLVELYNCIIKVFEFAFDALDKYIINYNNTSLAIDGNYQNYHMFMAIFNALYTVDFDKSTILHNEGKKQWKKDFNKYAYTHYLYDAVTEFWKINRQTSDLTKQIADYSKLNKYTTKISSETWDKALTEWIEFQNEVKTNIPKVNKLFLNVFYKLRESDPESNVAYSFEKNFDIEHIVPKKRFENKGLQKSLAVSHIANLCYLTPSDNRRKQYKTLYEYEREFTSFRTFEDYLKYIDYPDKSEINFLDYETNEWKQSYVKYLNIKYDRMTEIFKRMICEN